jgi:hypothetical protein
MRKSRRRSAARGSVDWRGAAHDLRFGAMRLWPATLAVWSLAALATGAACLPGSGPAINPIHDDAGPGATISLDDGGGLPVDVSLGAPFAIVGLLPSHGPWTGGTRTTVAGRGFSSSLQVWIGPTALGASDVFASSPTRMAIVTPPGTPGPADVRVRNVSTGEERTLAAGFLYDAFAVSPSSGATTGGTRIALTGSGTSWTAASVVNVGGQPCAATTFVDATDITCTTPPGAAGSTDVTVTNGDGSIDQARDAFTYGDSPDGYRGGLYGNSLAGALEVLAFDSLTGTPLAGGRAIAGSTLATAVLGVFDSSGAVHLQDPSLTGKVTVTVVAKCHQPVTFVDVPVDTVTAYLNPVLDPSCGSDPPSNGDYYPVLPGQVSGQLVWTGGIEFERAPWNNVPTPKGSERAAAYVFAATGNPLDTFRLPGADSATTPASSGVQGYDYSTYTLPGSQTLYALAGLEDRTVSPPRFVPYAMGIARGVLVPPGGQTTNVDIPMNAPLDHALVTMPLPPPAATGGPDRLLSILSMSLGAGLFAVLPQGTVTTLLPVSAPVPFIGVPALSGGLAGLSYDVTGAAVTGPSDGYPLSVVARIETTDANDPLTIGGFFSIPTLVEPSASTWRGTHLTLQASGPIDLALVNVSSGNALVVWTIVAPGSDLSFDLPDLTQLPDIGTLVHGPLTTTFSIARLGSFDYGRLRYGQLSSSAWSAYAQDIASGSY